MLGVEGVTALRGISFDIKEGELILILGTSGGGKTTLLNIMGTIDKPTKVLYNLKYLQGWRLYMRIKNKEFNWGQIFSKSSFS